MKHIFSLLVVAALFIGCTSERQETNAVQHSADTNFLTTESGVIIFGTYQDPVQAVIERWMRGRQPAFQIEGNFTGSGNREIIGFFETQFGGINQVVCFVFDSSGENIASVHEINFITGRFFAEDEAMTGLSDDLGSPIIHRGHIIGRFGDFNNNGIDELYLFVAGGISFEPRFFEFNGTEFARILERDFVSEATIVGIDPVEKIITLREVFFWDRTIRGGNIDMTEEINAYIWDEAAQRYILLSSDIRNFVWNRDLQRYEEVQLTSDIRNFVWNRDLQRFEEVQ